MPLYEYEVSGTGQRYEVMRSIHSELKTWGELATFHFSAKENVWGGVGAIFPN